MLMMPHWYSEPITKWMSRPPKHPRIPMNRRNPWLVGIVIISKYIILVFKNAIWVLRTTESKNANKNDWKFTTNQCLSFKNCVSVIDISEHFIFYFSNFFNDIFLCKGLFPILTFPLWNHLWFEQICYFYYGTTKLVCNTVKNNC